MVSQDGEVFRGLRAGGAVLAESGSCNVGTRLGLDGVVNIKPKLDSK